MGVSSTQKNLNVSCSAQTLRKAVPVNFSIWIGKSDILLEDKIISLEVWFDPDLSSKHHVTSLCSKTNRTLLFLNSVNKELDFKSKLLIVHALDFSHIHYCLWILGEMHQTPVEESATLLNFAARITYNGNRSSRDYVSPLREECLRLNVNKRQTHFILVYKELKVNTHPAVAGTYIFGVKRTIDLQEITVVSTLNTEE